MKPFILFISLVSMLSFPGNTIAQQKQMISLGSVTQKDKTVLFTLTSPSQFYVGGNTYILYLGNKNFHLYNQSSQEDGKGILTFLIPVEDFNGLPDGTNMYLSYGAINQDQQEDMEALSKQDESRCWSLGKFSKDLLTK